MNYLVFVISAINSGADYLRSKALPEKACSPSKTGQLGNFNVLEGEV